MNQAEKLVKRVERRQLKEDKRQKERLKLKIFCLKESSRLSHILGKLWLKQAKQLEKQIK